MFFSCFFSNIVQLSMDALIAPPSDEDSPSLSSRSASPPPSSVAEHLRRWSQDGLPKDMSEIQDVLLWQLLQFKPEWFVVSQARVLTTLPRLRGVVIGIARGSFQGPGKSIIPREMSHDLFDEVNIRQQDTALILFENALVPICFRKVSKGGLGWFCSLLLLISFPQPPSKRDILSHFGRQTGVGGGLLFDGEPSIVQARDVKIISFSDEELEASLKTARRLFCAGNPPPPRKPAIRPDVELIRGWYKGVIDDGVVKMHANLKEAAKYLNSFEGANDIGTQTLMHVTDLHAKLHKDGEKEPLQLFPSREREEHDGDEMLTDGERLVNLFEIYGANPFDGKLLKEERQTLEMYCKEMSFLFVTQGLLGRLLVRPTVAKTLKRSLSSSTIMQSFALKWGGLFELIATSLTRAWEMDVRWLEEKLDDLHDLLLDDEERKRGKVERFSLAQERLLNASYPHARDETDLLSSVYEELTKSVEKTMGQFYTPRPVVNFMLEKVDPVSQVDRQNYDPAKDRVKLMIDPSCGSGGFCAAYAARAVKLASETHGLWKSAVKVEAFLKSLVSAVYGVDLDPFACHLTKLNLVMQILPLIKRLEELGRSEDQISAFLKGIPGWNVFHADTLSVFGLSNCDLHKTIFMEGTERRLFDYVVGNPPFIAVRNNKSAFAFLEQNGWKSDKNTLTTEKVISKLSLMHWFLLMSRKLLSPRGRLLMVAPQSCVQYEVLTDLLLQSMTISIIYRFPPFIVFKKANTDIAILVASGTEIGGAEVKVLSPPPGVLSSCEAYLSAYDGEDDNVVPLTMGADCAKELSERVSTNYWGRGNPKKELRQMFGRNPFLADVCEFQYGMNPPSPKTDWLKADWKDVLKTNDLSRYTQYGVQFIPCVETGNCGFGACSPPKKMFLLIVDPKKFEKLAKTDPLKKLQMKNLKKQVTESAKVTNFFEKRHKWSLFSGAIKEGIRRVGFMPQGSFHEGPNFLISNGRSVFSDWEGLPFALIAWLSSRLRYAYLLLSQNAVTKRKKPAARDTTNETLAVLDPLKAKTKGPRENGTPLPFDSKNSEMAVALELFGREQHRLSELIWKQDDLTGISVDSFVLGGPIQGKCEASNLLLLKATLVHCAIDMMLFEVFNVSPELRSIIENPLSQMGEDYPLLPSCVMKLKENGWLSHFTTELQGSKTKPVLFARQLLDGAAQLKLDLWAGDIVIKSPSRKKASVFRSPKGNDKMDETKHLKKKKLNIEADGSDVATPVVLESSEARKKIRSAEDDPEGAEIQVVQDVGSLFIVSVSKAETMAPIIVREKFDGSTLIVEIFARACELSQSQPTIHQLLKQVDNSPIRIERTLSQSFGEPDHVHLLLATRHMHLSGTSHESSLKKHKK